MIIKILKQALFITGAVYFVSSLKILVSGVTDKFPDFTLD